jgi:hypothetical protein
MKASAAGAEEFPRHWFDTPAIFLAIHQLHLTALAFSIDI